MRYLLLGLWLFVPSVVWAATGIEARLQAVILSACPSVTSISVDPGAGAVSTLPSSQDACVRAAMDVFNKNDIAAQLTFDNLQGRADAVTAVASGKDSASKLARALAAVLLDEINVLRAAYPLPVTSITRSGTVATVTTRWAHGLSGTPTLTIHGADVAAYNGSVVIAVTGATTFTYTVAGSPATPAAGSLLAFPVTATPAARTLSQAVTAIQNKLNAGTVD